jgi:tRNA A37 threonylcarbamoyltransferase TsaD
MSISEIDAIAYTRGPGMYACLGVSAASAKALGAGFGKPVIGIHHMVRPYIDRDSADGVASACSDSPFN